MDEGVVCDKILRYREIDFRGASLQHANLILAEDLRFDVNHRKNPGARVFETYLFPDKIFTGRVPTHQVIYSCDNVGDFKCIYGPIGGLFLLEKLHYIDNDRFAWWNPATKCYLTDYRRNEGS
ncbi:hypothetical protein HAX54_028598 [Datura stramonium]|uniref:Pentapeptide repeat-containing protein n=1 Tax=Datura stramonium TaxID=4076 RepID=A0ABS8V4E0_DATST|nr:hypothetical protein [Datura stramonium]